MSSTPRRWLELGARSLSGDPGGALLPEGLVALGGRAVEERDGWYLTDLPEPPDADRFLRDARMRLEELTGVSDLELRVRWQEQADWAEIWKRGLRPRRIGARIIVTPSWEEPGAGPDDCVIVIDPGMAFGTAEHGTTRGCLRLLDRVPVEGATVLDVGAGSGILSVAAVKLGAKEVLAVEGDPLAHEALEENIARNGVRERVTTKLWRCDAAGLARLGPMDGALANIETGGLRGLLPGMRAAVRLGGWLILAGITVEEWADVSAEVEAMGFRLVQDDVDEGWRSGWFVHERD